MLAWSKRILPLIILLLAVLLGSLMVALREEAPRQPRVQPQPVVDVISAVRGPVQLSIQSQGIVQPKHQINLVSEVSGRVTWVSGQLVNGGLVKQGDALLRIDSIDYQLAVAEARAGLADATLKLRDEQAEFRRGTAYKAANQQQSGDSLRQAKLEQVQAQFDAASARLRQAQRDLDNTEVKAPFAGVIENKQMDLGQYVSTGTVLLRLLGTGVAEVRLPVTAADIGLVAPAVMSSGDWPPVELRARFGREQVTWQASLVRSERRVDEQTRVFYLVAELADPYGLENHQIPLTMGLFVDATIPGIVVPQASQLPRAVLHEDRFIYLVEDGKLVRRDVEVLRRDAHAVVIGAGLDAADQVVLSRLDLMVPGMPVKPVAVAQDQ